ncbi:MAG: TonB-dependent receptor [bacterium]|nr:TonB-dependent receptor [bacterium]
MKKSYGILLMLFFLVPAVIFSQGSTTGAFSGTVVDVDGNAVLGAEVVIFHVPTGTRSTTLSRGNGQYSVPSVRPGGPYTITVSFTGFKTEKKEGVAVRLGETKIVDFTLQLATVDAGEVVVTASDSVINPYRTGASQNVTQESIEDLPTISRSLGDFTRLSPQIISSDETAGAFNVGGRSSRYNNIQIDGAQNNDLFGLGSTGTPGGQSEATVISLEAVQEFQIVMAPYDVRQGGFTGGGVNVITKSGTNNFFGSIFYEARDEKFVGDGPDEFEFNQFTEGVVGASRGGPLIKNKLFFFVNFEYNNRKVPEDFFIDGSGANYDWGNQALADRFNNKLSSLGYDSGGYGEVSNQRKKTNIFARIDWNINDNHRLTLRHSFLDSNFENLSRSSSSSFTMGNGGITYLTESNNTVLQLNSTLSDNIFNELTVNYQTIRDNPTYMGDPFPKIIVRDSNIRFYAGSEEYRHKNQLDQDLIEITNNLTLFKGNHTLVFGTHNEFFKFYNVFIQRAFGKYDFASMDDFEAGNPSRFDRYYSLTGDPNAPAQFSVSQIGFYVMDEWNVNPSLKLTLGLRADVPLMPDVPNANPAVVAAFGIPTNQNAGGNILWSPRVGFNYAHGKDLQIRGGVGIFSGRAPYVWISNQYSNTGTDLGRYRINDPGFFITDPNGQPTAPGSAPAPGDINLIDDGFKFPQVFKTNIAVDKKLPFGFTGTVEFVYSKAVNEIFYQNINIVPTGATNAFDGRPLMGTQSTSSGRRYGNPNLLNSGFFNVLLLGNTSEGYEWIGSFQLQKEWGRGNMINASYAYGEAKEMFGGTSSRAISNWGYNNVSGNPNEPDLSWSTYDPGHSVKIALTKKFRFFRTAATTFSLFYNGRSGRRYSTLFYNDVNGDGRANDLAYIPAAEGEFIITRGTWDDVNTYISNDPALDAARGSIIGRNASRDPWFHGMDVKLSQEIPIPGMKGHRLSLYVTVKNFLNMLNKDWGIYRYVNFDDTPFTFTGYDSTTGKPTIQFWGRTTDADARYTINQLLSRWQALFGIKYRF